MLKIFTLIIALFPLTGCDNHAFTQFFRNPYIVEVGELDTLNADQWYEFKTFAKALNKKQVIRIEFLGSDPTEFDFESRESDRGNTSNASPFYSKRFPGKKIIFEVIASSSKGEDYKFRATGRSSGIRFINASGESLIGDVITKIRIKSNIDLRDIKLTWISRTGK